MDFKLVVLFFLIGSIVGLSHLGHKSLTKMNIQIGGQRWFAGVPRRRKS